MTMQTTVQPAPRHLQRAQRYFDDGQLVAACATLEAHLRRTPDDADSLSLLLHAWLKRGRMRPAVELAQRLAALPARDAQAALRTATDLMRVGDFTRARALLDTPLVQDSRDSAVLFRHAQLRARAGEYQQVLALTELAAQLGATPDTDLLLLRARARDYCGDADGAGADYSAAQHQRPDSGSAAQGLARVHASQRDADAATAHIAHLHSVLPSVTDADTEAALAYALFEELHTLQQYQQAWPALQRGAAAAHRQWPYDAAREATRIDALLRTQPGTAATAVPQSAPAGTATPIFIVGLPRSGTSLLETLLGRHTQVSAGGEHADFAYQLGLATDCDSVELLPMTAIERSADIDYHALGQAYLEHTRWRARGRSHYTDKLPSNWMLIAHIARALPQARIVHVARAPMDAAFAVLRQLLGAAYPWSFAQQDIVAHYGHYRALMSHWQRALPGRLLQVDYAEFADAERLLRRVCAFCALPFEAQCLDARLDIGVVATPSSLQVRDAIRPRVGAWQAYREHLDILRDGLAGWHAPA